MHVHISNLRHPHNSGLDVSGLEVSKLYAIGNFSQGIDPWCMIGDLEQEKLKNARLLLL